MLSSTSAGLGLGLSLIIAIGAQNLFVLRQGVRREHTLTVALVCMVSDAALILAGVAGIGAVLAQAPWLIGVVRWAGAAFLIVYGLLAPGSIPSSISTPSSCSGRSPTRTAMSDGGSPRVRCSAA